MESKAVAIIVVVAAMCPLTFASRVTIHSHSGGEGECPDGLVCTPAPCEIENSNMAAGPECACLPGFTGEITWSGSIPSGACIPAACGIVGTEGSGPDCQCQPGLQGTITWDADVPRGECFAPCEIENSNMAAGRECACKSGFTGKITWNGPHPSGACIPADCGIVGTTGSGLDCKCMPGLQGAITWDDDVPQGECVVEAIKLFKKSGVFKVKYDDVYKKIKCCVSSNGQPTKLQDLKVETPDAGTNTMAFAKNNKERCEYMFGDGYHNARKGSTCPVPVAEFMQVTGYSLEEALNQLKTVTG